MSSTPTFTIIMPLYNHAAYVGQAVESALAQRFGDFELVVCNDGSTDESLATVDAFRDERIRVIDKPNGGTVSALNACLVHARGRFVCWLSSDDLFAPGKLALHHAHHQAQPDSVLSLAPFGYLRDGSTQADVQLQPEAPARLAQFLEGNYVNGLSVCAARGLYTQYGLFDGRYRYAHDVERWFQFLARHPAAVLGGEPQSYSRMATSIVADADMLGELDVLKLVYSQLDLGGLKALLPVAQRADALDVETLLMLCMRLFSPSNLFSRYQLVPEAIQMAARSVRAEGAQDLLATVAGVLRDHGANDCARLTLACVKQVAAAADHEAEPGLSFAEQLVRLRDAATADADRRILTRYLRTGL